jgi:hypothetical protein
MTDDQEYAADLLEEMCGPLDELLAEYKDAFTPAQTKKLGEIRDCIEEMLTELQESPDDV